MNALGIFGTIFLIFIFLGVLTVILLAAFGFFEETNKRKLIQGKFSVERGLQSSDRRYMLASTQDQVVFSGDTSIKCSDYIWTYGTFSSGSISIANALITDKNKIVVANAAQDGATIKVITPTAATDTTLAQWNYTDVDIWCLSSNTKLCLFEGASNVVGLKNFTTNSGFLLTPVKAVSSSNICTT